MQFFLAVVEYLCCRLYTVYPALNPLKEVNGTMVENEDAITAQPTLVHPKELRCMQTLGDTGIPTHEPLKATFDWPRVLKYRLRIGSASTTQGP